MAQVRVDDPTSGTEPVAPPVQLNTTPPVSTTQPVTAPVKQPTADQPVSTTQPVATPQPVVSGTPPIPSSGAGNFAVNPVTGQPWTMNLGQPITPGGNDTTSNQAGTTPSYVNPNDPASAAVWAAYQKKGITPRDPSDFQYWVDKINQTGGFADPGNASYWTNRMAQAAGGVGDYSGAPEAGSGGSGAGASGSSFSGTSVFDDPATAQYEQLINQLTQQLTTPYTPPDYQSAIDQLRAYVAQLNGPAYTPQQMDLMQTQSLDPLSAQRDAARQQIIQHYAAIGQGPSSGTVQSALQQSDQNFEKLRTQTQAGFATQAVNKQQQNAATAAQVAPQIAALESQQNSGNESRALQGVNLAGIIPALAQSRITGANSLLQPINTASLLQQLLGAQQTGYNQSSQYTSGIIQLLTQLIGAT